MILVIKIFAGMFLFIILFSAVDCVKPLTAMAFCFVFGNLYSSFVSDNIFLTSTFWLCKTTNFLRNLSL